MALKSTDIDPLNPLEWPNVWTWPDRQTDVPSWQGHIPFAFLLVSLLAPRVLVELGTHKGDSYFAFCQAVARAGLATRCYAVDTWEGDAHAGYYGEHVYREVSWYNAVRYSAFSTLLRMTFDEAVQRFDNGSVDLLHIDGLHTYEAVRHDFDTWLPKMSDRGVVLLHDIAVRTGDFGVWRLWQELTRQYPTLAFAHSYGLGVVAVGRDIPEPIRRWLQMPEDQARGFRQLFAFLGEAVLQRARPLCSIVIPQYGRADLTIACVRSLQSTVLPRHACEVIVVDDGSLDNAATEVEHAFGHAVTVVRNPTNLGFAGACNRGAAVAKGSYVVFLNNDTISVSDWLAPMLMAMNDPQVGIVGAKLLTPSGAVHHAGGTFVSTALGPLTWVHREARERAAPEVNQSQPVPAVTGACMLVRRAEFLELGGFDEAFVNDFEDIDLCLRMTQRGRRIWYEARAELIHLVSQTRGHNPHRFFTALGRFYRKWLQEGLFVLRLPSPPSVANHKPVDYVIYGCNNRPRVWQAVQTVVTQWKAGDRLVLIDGGADDGTSELMSNIARNNPEHVVYVQTPLLPPVEEWRAIVPSGLDSAARGCVIWAPEGSQGPDGWLAHLAGWTPDAMLVLR